MSPATPRRPLDHYARLVQRLLRVPVGLVTLVEEHEQVFVGVAGTTPSGGDRTPLTHSFCHIVVTDGHALVVSDARNDARLASHPAVTQMGVVAYAGWPLYDADGRAIGSLCAVEHGPREWDVDEVNVLRELAQGCSAELQRSATMAALEQELATLRRELASLRR